MYLAPCRITPQFIRHVSLYFTKRIQCFRQMSSRSRIEINAGKKTAFVFIESNWQNRFKYLKVTINIFFAFSPHLEVGRKRTIYFLTRLYFLICGKSNMSTRNSVTSCKTCILPGKRRRFYALVINKEI